MVLGGGGGVSFVQRAKIKMPSSRLSSVVVKREDER